MQWSGGPGMDAVAYLAISEPAETHEAQMGQKSREMKTTPTTIKTVHMLGGHEK